jgi:hypothetical protein
VQEPTISKIQKCARSRLAPPHAAYEIWRSVRLFVRIGRPSFFKVDAGIIWNIAADNCYRIRSFDERIRIVAATTVSLTTGVDAAVRLTPSMASTCKAHGC